MTETRNTKKRQTQTNPVVTPRTAPGDEPAKKRVRRAPLPDDAPSAAPALPPPPAPVVQAPAPIVQAPAPAVQAPLPVVQAPLPVVQAPAPAVQVQAPAQAPAAAPPPPAAAPQRAADPTRLLLFLYVAWCMSYSNVQDAPVSSPWSRFRFILVDVVVFATFFIVPSTLIFTPRGQRKERLAAVLRIPAAWIGRLLLVLAFELALQSVGTELLILYHASFRSLESAKACATDLRNAGGFVRSQAADTLDCYYPFLRHWQTFVVPGADLLCRRVLGEPGLCAGFRFEQMLAMLNRSSMWISTGMCVADLVGLLIVMVLRMDAPVNATWFARVRHLASTLLSRPEFQTYLGILSVRTVTLYAETLVHFKLIRLSMGLADSSLRRGHHHQLQGVATLLRTYFGVSLFLAETLLAVLAERAVLKRLQVAAADHWLAREFVWAAVSVLMFPWVNPVIRADVEAVFDYFV